MPLTKPQLTVFGPDNNATVNLTQPFPITGQVTNQFVSGEPVSIDSVTVRVDAGAVIDAALTPVLDKTQTRVKFAASAQVTGGPGPHNVTITAINDQNLSATKTISVLTAPVVVTPPASYIVHHNYFGSLENVTVHQKDETVMVTYALSRDISIRHPGQLNVIHSAYYFVHMKAGGPSGHPTQGRADLPLTVKIYSPDGLEFAGRNITLDDLNRFRDLRGASLGCWRCQVTGNSGPIDLSDEPGMFITAGQATVSVSLDEPVPSESAGPLVEGTVTKAGAQVFSFDLFRVGQFTANVQSKSGVTPWEGKLQQRSPDGTVVASSQSNRLDFPVTLRTIDQSRDAAGQVRPWSLEIDTATPLGVGSAVRATVIATARIPVVLFQDRINDLIGFNGNKVQIYCENKDGRALGRFKILNEYTAETINMYHLLDRVIKKVDQDPEVDTENIDIEPNIPYNLMNISASLGYGLSFNAGSLKVDAIKIRLGASQHIQPTVPAIGVEVDIEGALEVNFGGFNLANVSVSNSRLTLEVGARLDASGYLMTVSWVNDDPFDVDIAWEAALLADILTDELINLGEGGLADYIIDHVGNDFIINLFRSTVESAIFQTPFIMSVLLGAAVTLNSMRMDNSTNEIAIDYLPPVEPDPKPNPFYTGIIGRSVTRLGPGSWQISPPSLGDTWAAGNLMNKIDHIVVVMMENRAFDHVLGYRATLPNAQGAKTD